MTLDQSDYIEKILDRFKMSETKPTDTPMVTRQVSDRNIRTKDRQVARVEVPMREAIGCLLYLAGGTRPDITFSVNLLASFQLNPTEDDWEDVKRVMRYLRGTSKMGLTF